MKKKIVADVWKIIVGLTKNLTEWNHIIPNI